MDGADRSTVRKPFIEHVQEVRRRLMWCCLALFIGGGVGYYLYERLLDMIQRPLGQTLYYTSPTGGFNFVFKICMVFGLVFALPVISYQLFKFLEPVSSKQARTTILKYVLWSVILAYLGILFGYYVSLPAALHFLTQFGGENIQSLITADEYFSFALAYIAGFALLFQLPLIVLFTNRINPLKPSGMFGAQKFIILGSFIVAAVLTPTPDPMNQLLMALPIVLLYQVSIVLVWITNRPKRNRRNNIQVKPVHQSRHVPLAPKHIEYAVPSVAPARIAPSTAYMPQRPQRVISDMVVVRRQPVRPQYVQRAATRQQSNFRTAFAPSRPHKLIDITV